MVVAEGEAVRSAQGVRVSRVTGCSTINRRQTARPLPSGAFLSDRHVLEEGRHARGGRPHGGHRELRYIGRVQRLRCESGTTAALTELDRAEGRGDRADQRADSDCRQERSSSGSRARAPKRSKALAVDPNSTGAWLCMATIHESMRMPIDSVIHASQNALKGDSCNGTAWENIARGYQQKGDTAKMVDAFICSCAASHTTSRSGSGSTQMLRQQKNFDRAVEVLDDGLQYSPNDQQMLDLKLTICNEAGSPRLLVVRLRPKIQERYGAAGGHDIPRPAFGAAQQASDTAALLLFTGAAGASLPQNARLQPRRGRARSSWPALPTPRWSTIRRRSRSTRTMSPRACRIAKIYPIGPSTIRWRPQVARGAKDTAGVRRMQQASPPAWILARPYAGPGWRAPDSTQRLAASVIMLTGGSKLAQARAYPGAYPWLDTLPHRCGAAERVRHARAQAAGPYQRQLLVRTCRPCWR